MPRTSSWVSVMNCEVDGSSGSMICACTPCTPGTSEIARIVAPGRIPPAGKPVPMPMPRPATEIWTSTFRSPPSMKRTMRSLIAPRATSPATPIAMPTTVKRSPRRTRSDLSTSIAAPRSRRRPDRVRDRREGSGLRVEPVLRAQPADERRDEVGHPARRERLQHEQPDQHWRGGGRRRGDERATRARREVGGGEGGGGGGGGRGGGGGGGARGGGVGGGVGERCGGAISIYTS